VRSRLHNDMNDMNDMKSTPPVQEPLPAPERKRNWINSTPYTKIASIGMALALVLNILTYISYNSGYYELVSLISFFEKLEISDHYNTIFLISIILDAAITLGLFFLWRWARDVAIWGGIASAIMLVWYYHDFTIIDINIANSLLENLLNVICALLLLFARKDFRKKPPPERDEMYGVQI